MRDAEELGSKNTRRLVERKYRNDIQRLSRYWPKEQVSLEEAYSGRSYIYLQNGEIHDFSHDEISLLASSIPRFLWRLVSLPLLLRYEVVGTERYYRVLGNTWQKRLAEIMLTGDYSYSGKEKLTISEFSTILRKYRSLIFVNLSI